jgi:ABC-type lipoprotein export system ATPase subunit
MNQIPLVIRPTSAGPSIDAISSTFILGKSTPSKKIIIDASSIVKSYKVKKQIIPAVNGVSLQIYEGEFVALMGASGSGKSTLLQLLGGLDKPTSGNIIIDGVNIEKLSDRKLSRFRGKMIGFVFQFFYLQPFLRLSRNIEVPGMFARMKRKQRKMRIQQLAEIVGLADRLDHFPSELSGGQIQRTAIIRALFNQPKILLADEPTGNLDSQNGAAILDLFDQVRRQFGTTIIVATHDPTIAARADRTITLKDGALL